MIVSIRHHHRHKNHRSFERDRCHQHHRHHFLTVSQKQLMKPLTNTLIVDAASKPINPSKTGQSDIKLSYESYHMRILKQFGIFTCMFVTLETIKKIRNRNLKCRVSSPSFMVSEKQSWLHPKFYNCGQIGSFLVNLGLVLC